MIRLMIVSIVRLSAHWRRVRTWADPSKASMTSKGLSEMGREFQGGRVTVFGFRASLVWCIRQMGVFETLMELALHWPEADAPLFVNVACSEAHHAFLKRRTGRWHIRSEKF